MKLLKNLTKVFLVNIGIFLFCVLTIEIIFGHWFSEHSFGPYMREHRLKKNLMTYDETQSRITFDYYTRFQNKNYLKIFEEFILHKEYDFDKIITITSLIYLNMAPLHTYPFNRLCFSLGKIFLYENLLKNERL